VRDVVDTHVLTIDPAIKPVSPRQPIKMLTDRLPGQLEPVVLLTRKGISPDNLARRDKVSDWGRLTLQPLEQTPSVIMRAGPRRAVIAENPAHLHAGARLEHCRGA
jgi:hypothetical protein